MGYQTDLPLACQFAMVFGLTLAVIMGSLAALARNMRFETLGMGFSYGETCETYPS